MDDTAAFFAAYDAVLRRWPVEVDSVDVPTPYGSTRVHIGGREDGAPLVLLPGGGTTSTAWFANAGALAPAHRIYAVDLMGDIGRSVHDGAPLRGAADLTAWLDSLFDELKLEGAHLCGHSYGAWIALGYALHAPHRLGRLALLDPVGCFTGMSPRYLAHALPMLLKPTAERVRAFHRGRRAVTPRIRCGRRSLRAPPLPAVRRSWPCGAPQSGISRHAPSRPWSSWQNTAGPTTRSVRPPPHAGSCPGRASSCCPAPPTTPCPPNDPPSSTGC
jgi:pimeloyl-ACP methyl ester carboxylesterase